MTGNCARALKKHMRDATALSRPSLVAGILAVIFYEAITPVSVLIAVGPPLWVAWALHGNVLKAPTFWALIAMLPLKFPPFHPFKWII